MSAKIYAMPISIEAWQRLKRRSAELAKRKAELDKLRAEVEAGEKTAELYIELMTTNDDAQ